MAISLQKGQRVSLTKENPNLSSVMVGLGWDPIKQSTKGLFSSLFGASESQIDCDSSVIMLDADGKIRGKESIIYFANLKSKCGSVQHMGDNRTGNGDGDDEQIMINLNSIPQNIDKLVFVVNIYKPIERKQHFGMIKNAVIRLVNCTDNKEILNFNLTEECVNKTGMIMAEMYRSQNEWKFAAIGEGHTCSGLGQLIEMYR